MTLISPKPTRLLVFCGTRKAIERFDLAGWLVIVPEYPMKQRQALIGEFCSTPDCRLAVLGKSFAIGWRAPADTLVLFDPSWPYGPDAPESIQAVARVAIR